MSCKLRRAAGVSPAAPALTAGGAVSAAGAAAAPVPPVTANRPDAGSGFRGGHEPPMHFGPFEIPKFGSVSGGFSWGLAR
ncbi:hypothetical protein N6Q81_03315 [Streptomyces vinaceusdrappus]|uniref:Uncharacterized protein n=1 Tax=Streptomyces vinaceusdrappus TaxID=67376 RepID=A0ABY6BSG2_9ACTN|nr:hypothetical protein [Streptomyces vinaceusdrappus]UXI77149.1 hypothetical protein N6Q81_03315 [Streptomyces vinaceusdrappus]